MFKGQICNLGNLGHVSVHLNFVGVFSSQKIQSDQMLGKQFAENSQPSALQGGLKKIGVDFFLCQGSRVNEHRKIPSLDDVQVEKILTP